MTRCTNITYQRRCRRSCLYRLAAQLITTLAVGKQSIVINVFVCGCRFVRLFVSEYIAGTTRSTFTKFCTLLGPVLAALCYVA